MKLSSINNNNPQKTDTDCGLCFNYGWPLLFNSIGTKLQILRCVCVINDYIAVCTQLLCNCTVTFLSRGSRTVLAVVSIECVGGIPTNSYSPVAIRRWYLHPSDLPIGGTSTHPTWCTQFILYLQARLNWKLHVSFVSLILDVSSFP